MDATYDFTDHVAIVTGAGSGIGAAAAQQLAAAGASVLCADVDDDGAEQTVAAITDAGGEAVARHTDVSDEESVREMVAAAVDRWGRLDIAHNNAGILGSFSPTADYPVDLFDRIMAVNARGVFLCMQAQIAQMLTQGGGAIVNTSSAAGIRAQPGAVGYTASKHAVSGMTKVAAVEYAPAGIRVNAVNPGGVETPMTERTRAEMMQGLSDEAKAAAASAPDLHPIGRSAKPAEIAQVMMWLSSDAASFVTGHNLVVDGALTIGIG